MSIAMISSAPNKMDNKIPSSSSQWKINDSGELDVFEAARYFSDAVYENPDRQRFQRVARLSLDMPAMRQQQQHVINPPKNHHSTMDQNQKKENNKKHKQPSSPVGKIASFLNSLFNQTSSKKKKLKSGTTKNVEDDHQEIKPKQRRRSIGHFGFTSNNNKTCGSNPKASRSDFFRTPPHYYANTPIKSYKEFKSLFDHGQSKVSVLPNKGDQSNLIKPKLQNEVYSEKTMFSDKVMKSSTGFSDRNLVHDCLSEDREFTKFSSTDDGGDSDSSSDLFDLPTAHLPVYEATHVSSRIKIGAPVVSNAAATV